MGCPYLEDCSKQKWIANDKSFKNPKKQDVCPFLKGIPTNHNPMIIIVKKTAKCRLTVRYLCFAVFYCDY